MLHSDKEDWKTWHTRSSEEGINIKLSWKALKVGVCKYIWYLYILNERNRLYLIKHNALNLGLNSHEGAFYRKYCPLGGMLFRDHFLLLSNIYFFTFWTNFIRDIITFNLEIGSLAKLFRLQLNIKSIALPE